VGLTAYSFNKNVLKRVFYAVRSVSKKKLDLCIPLKLLGNNSTNMFLWQRSVGGVVSYAIRFI
jgi:hypothetical protein